MNRLCAWKLWYFFLKCKGLFVFIYWRFLILLVTKSIRKHIHSSFIVQIYILNRFLTRRKQTLSFWVWLGFHPIIVRYRLSNNAVDVISEYFEFLKKNMQGFIIVHVWWTDLTPYHIKTFDLRILSGHDDALF